VLGAAIFAVDNTTELHKQQGVFTCMGQQFVLAIEGKAVCFALAGVDCCYCCHSKVGGMPANHPHVPQPPSFLPHSSANQNTPVEESSK
jgi:hypothetical protein